MNGTSIIAKFSMSLKTRSVLPYVICWKMVQITCEPSTSRCCSTYFHEIELKRYHIFVSCSHNWFKYFSEGSPFPSKGKMTRPKGKSIVIVGK